MDKILLEGKYILEYIKDILHDTKIKKEEIKDAKYHHNSSYKNASSICHYGILTIQDLVNKGLVNYSDDFLEIMDDQDSHVNGINAISLSITGLKDLYHNEIEYNPFSPIYVDFLITNEIFASRRTIHYGNEFLHNGSLGIDKLRSVDIRLINLIKNIKTTPDNNNEIKEIIENFNQLHNIAISMRESNLDIPIREMSDSEYFSLDKDKLSSMPKLILKP